MAGTASSWADLNENDNASAPSTSVTKLAENLQQVSVSEEKVEVKADEPEPLTELHPNDETAKVEVLGVSQDTIYKAATSFQELGLSPNLLKGVVDMNFVSPSKIQAQALPIILSQNHPNLQGQAHHGSGKTAAYSLGMLSRVDESKTYPQALCVCPVRELANQVTEVINRLAKHTSIRAQAAVPNSDRGQTTAQIVVGTAGTILAQMRARQWDPKHIKMLVLDEADVMIDQHAGQATDSLQIKQKLPRDVQLLLFSATFPTRVEDFAAKFAPKSVIIRVKTEALKLETISQFVIPCANKDMKFSLLENLYGLANIGSSIVFVQTVATAKDVCNRMRAAGYKVSLLHGKDMQPQERDRVMQEFRDNVTNVLITTNVLARGVDVLSVNVVINYDLPFDRFGRLDHETYMHRIGRTGRFGRKGCAINFVDDRSGMEKIAELEGAFKMTIKPLNPDLEEMGKAVRGALGQ